MLRRVHCYGCAFCASLRDTAYGMLSQYPTGTAKINVTFYSLTLARTIWFPDDGPRTETCRSVFYVPMFSCVNFIKFYTCAVVGIIIE